ncbi:hypothetical protein BDV11DRAFT_134031 [Aspergillus similis]
MLFINHDTSKTLAADACARQVRACESIFLDRAPSRLIYLAATCCSIALTSYNPAGVASRRVGQSGVCVRKLRNLLENSRSPQRTGVQTTREAAFRYIIQPRVGRWGVSRHTAEPSYGVRLRPKLIGPFRKSTAAEGQRRVNCILQRVQAVYSQSYFHRESLINC